MDALLECHHRIRTFVAMAGRLAEVDGADRAGIADAAAQVHRYFTTAFPRHVEDEDVDVRAALADVDDPAVAAALATMTAEHGEHAAPIAALCAHCAALAAHPDELAARRGELGALVAALATAIAAHLAAEETIVFPALRALPEPRRATLGTAMRARRG